MLSKLKYVGVNTDDLLNIYILYIRSVTEYCSVAFHHSLTTEQAHKLENIQRTCLKIILAENYISYSIALEMCGLQTLYTRREGRCLAFGLKSIKHATNARMFPLNEPSEYNIRNREQFHVNYARTQQYKSSAIPTIQRMLNTHTFSNIT